MRELWRKSFELFRRHPVLWAPYVCAELIAFCLSTWRATTLRSINLRIRQAELGSPLGIRLQNFDLVRARHWAYALGWPLEWTVRYINVSLLTFALLTIAVLVGRLSRDSKLDSQNVAHSPKPGVKAVLLFALKLCAVTWIVTELLLVPLSYVEILINSGLTIYYPVPIGFMILEYVAVAWIMAPIALRLLRAPDAPAPNAQQKKAARFTAMLAVPSIAILEFVIPRLETHVYLRSRAAGRVLFATNDLAFNLPMLFLFIALAVLALEVPLTAEPPMHLPEPIKNLMPLHYPPADQPK